MATAFSHVPAAPDHLTDLMRDGFCVVRRALSPASIAALGDDLDPIFEETPRSQGPFYGAATRRFGGLLTRTHQAAALVQHRDILEIVGHMLNPWCDHFSLNLTQAIEILPGGAEQVPHRDQDMWPASRLIDPSLGVEFLVNVMWPLTPFTAQNGATRIWAGSHRRQDEQLIDPAEARPIKMTPGDALIFLGSTLHAGGANRTTLPRKGMIVSYSLGWLKPYELQWLVYPPDKARTFPPELAELVGYRIHRPNLGNVEGQCPSALLSGTPPAGAIDQLGIEQEEIIASYLRQRDGG